jgi:hypothetical protein
MTADFTPLKDKEKDNLIISASLNFSNKERERNYGTETQNRRRGIKEVSTTASPYEGSF